MYSHRDDYEMGGLGESHDRIMDLVIGFSGHLGGAMTGSLSRKLGLKKSTRFA